MMHGGSNCYEEFFTTYTAKMTIYGESVESGSFFPYTVTVQEVTVCKLKSNWMILVRKQKLLF